MGVEPFFGRSAAYSLIDSKQGRTLAIGQNLWNPLRTKRESRKLRKVHEGDMSYIYSLFTHVVQQIRKELQLLFVEGIKFHNQGYWPTYQQVSENFAQIPTAKIYNGQPIMMLNMKVGGNWIQEGNQKHSGIRQEQRLRYISRR